MDLSSLSSSEQLAMQQIIEQKQMKDFMRLYTGLVERCFSACCNDFTSKALTNKEFLKHSERVGARFSEENARLMSQQK
ncbi:protein transporter tim9 [Malassezia cuniculi]|uniref:Mitochondrial import inner membrane translocase subunit n=1 Tax=Malassezia cuniculi TaxID=948313 RepID=A0AAF0ERD3_9BASI|nr:protein transporter tim9 [Malassezia cuniculi]